MQLSDAIRNKIFKYLKDKNMTIWDLYRASGIPKSTIYAYLDSYAKLPNLDTLHHICEGLGITIREFFDDPVFDETEQD